MATGLGCSKPPPPPPPQPPPQVVAPPPKPPEPPPAPSTAGCESLEKKCVAVENLRLEVGTHGASFAPPVGWSFAREPERSIAIAPDGTAAVVFAPSLGTRQDEIFAMVQALVARLEISNLKTVSLKKRLDQPDTTLDAEGQELRLWEVDQKRQTGGAPKMKSKRGAMLVIAAPFGDQPVVGLGFVVKPPGEQHAAAVMQAVQSLRAKPKQ